MRGHQYPQSDSIEKHHYDGQRAQLRRWLTGGNVFCVVLLAMSIGVGCGGTPSASPSPLMNQDDTVAQDDAPTGVTEIVAEGGVWERRYIPPDGGAYMRTESFFLADNGRFGWHESAILDEQPSAKMKGEGYFRTGSWQVEGTVLVVTETRRRIDLYAENTIEPPIVRRLQLSACDAIDMEKTGAPKNLPCVTIENVPFIRAGDKKLAGKEIDYSER